MNKSIVLAVALMGVGGFALGWLAFGVQSRTRPAPPPAISSSAARPVEVERRYLLRPEDVQADRETPAVTADDQGHVVVAWASQTGPLERTIYLLRSSDGGTNFAPPVPWRKVPIFKFSSKAPGKSMTFSTHVLPRLATSPGTVWLGWVEAVNGGPEVRYLVARSTDGGASFSEPVNAHGDKAVKPGFTTLAAGLDGTLCASWLDGRGQGQQPFLSVGSAKTGEFGADALVFAGPDGKGVCPCCDLSVVRNGQGTTFVAFRNSDSGHRDIYIARSESGATDGFAPPVPVSSEPWTFEGCPHDGPSLALSGDRLHLLWMDAHTGGSRVYSASSPLDSLRFSPRPLSSASSSKRSQGHPRLVAETSGILHAVWDESLDAAEPGAAAGHDAGAGGHGHGHKAPLSGAGRAIMYASSDANGEFGPARAVAPHPGAFQLNPAIAVGPAGDLFVAWNELDTEGKQVVLVRLPPKNVAERR